MRYIHAIIHSIRQIDFAWGGMLFVAGSLCALLIVPSWQNNRLMELRARNVDISLFIDEINDLEVSIQDMRLASRGYIITQNVFFHQQYMDASLRQQQMMAKLIQDTSNIADSIDVNELEQIKQLIDEWRVQRLDRQVALVESNNVAAAEADFLLGAKIHAFDVQFVQALKRYVLRYVLNNNAYKKKPNKYTTRISLSIRCWYWWHYLR